MKKIIVGLILVLSYNCYANSDIQIVCGPYLQRVTDTEATILWHTNKDAFSWVELAPGDSTHFYNDIRPRFYQTSAGKRVIGKIHTIRIKGLEPGKSYRYRVFSHEVIDGNGNFTQFGQIAATKNVQATLPRFKTLDPNKEHFSFVVVNDIHENNNLLSSLLGNVKNEHVDFVVFNGDMVHDIHTPEKITNGFLNKSVELFASEVPFYYARGNHETRGHYAHIYMDMFPTTTGLPYYSFRQGNTFFVVLDCGDDKYDANIEYSGLADFENYRKEELKWLEALIETDEFKSATNRIVIIHIPPMIDSQYAALMIQKQFVPVLNRANIDLMLCGHRHRHFYYDKDYIGCEFPVLVNSNRNKVRVDVSENKLSVKVINDNDKLFLEVDIE